MESENRQSKRKDSLNLLDYVVVDESGKAVSRAMARTLNVSEKGILLETHLALKKDQILLITIGLEKDLVEIEGKITRIEQKEEESFCYGIEFHTVKDEDVDTLRKYLKEFNGRN